MREEIQVKESMTWWFCLHSLNNCRVWRNMQAIEFKWLLTLLLSADTIIRK